MNHRLCSLLIILAFAFQLSPSVAAEPTKKGAEAASDFLDPKKILESLPRELIKDIDTNSRNRVEAMDEASKKLRESFKDRTGSLSFNIRSISKMNGRYNVFATADGVRVAGTSIAVGYVVYFDESENEKVAKLKKGDKITASGKVFPMILGTKNPFMRLELGGAKLQ